MSAMSVSSLERLHGSELISVLIVFAAAPGSAQVAAPSAPSATRTAEAGVCSPLWKPVGGLGATLAAEGSASVAADDLRLVEMARVWSEGRRSP
jgi:hypothetical protein